MTRVCRLRKLPDEAPRANKARGDAGFLGLVYRQSSAGQAAAVQKKDGILCKVAVQNGRGAGHDTNGVRREEGGGAATQVD